MSILGNIFSRIFQHGSAQAQPPAGGAGTAPAPASTSTQTSGSAPSGTAPAQSASTSGATGTATAMQAVDVEAVLNGMAEKSPQKLNWRTSIVDLMKLLGLDSSLQARKELADELHYSGDKGDSAAMNIWLHKQVMRKLAENGGKVPADLKD
jgi:hypothetical protein